MAGASPDRICHSIKAVSASPCMKADPVRGIGRRRPGPGCPPPRYPLPCSQALAIAVLASSSTRRGTASAALRMTSPPARGKPTAPGRQGRQTRSNSEGPASQARSSERRLQVSGAASEKSPAGPSAPQAGLPDGSDRSRSDGGVLRLKGSGAALPGFDPGQDARQLARQLSCEEAERTDSFAQHAPGLGVQDHAP